MTCPASFRLCSIVAVLIATSLPVTTALASVIDVTITREPRDPTNPRKPRGVVQVTVDTGFRNQQVDIAGRHDATFASGKTDATGKFASGAQPAQQFVTIEVTHRDGSIEHFGVTSNSGSYISFEEAPPATAMLTDFDTLPLASSAVIFRSDGQTYQEAELLDLSASKTYEITSLAAYNDLNPRFYNAAQFDSAAAIASGSLALDITAATGSILLGPAGDPSNPPPLFALGAQPLSGYTLLIGAVQLVVADGNLGPPLEFAEANRVNGADSIPEPSALLLFGIAVGILGFAGVQPGPRGGNRLGRLILAGLASMALTGVAATRARALDIVEYRDQVNSIRDQEIDIQNDLDENEALLQQALKDPNLTNAQKQQAKNLFNNLKNTARTELDSLRHSEFLTYTQYVIEARNEGDLIYGSAYCDGQSPHSEVPVGSTAILTYGYLNPSTERPTIGPQIAYVEYSANTDPRMPNLFLPLGTSSDTTDGFGLSTMILADNILFQAIPFDSAGLPIFIPGVGGDNVAPAYVLNVNEALLVPEPPSLLLLIAALLFVTVGRRALGR